MASDHGISSPGSVPKAVPATYVRQGDDDDHERHAGQVRGELLERDAAHAERRGRDELQAARDAPRTRASTTARGWTTGRDQAERRGGLPADGAAERLDVRSGTGCRRRRPWPAAGWRRGPPARPATQAWRTPRRTPRRPRGGSRPSTPPRSGRPAASRGGSWHRRCRGRRSGSTWTTVARLASGGHDRASSAGARRRTGRGTSPRAWARGSRSRAARSGPPPGRPA